MAQPPRASLLTATLQSDHHHRGAAQPAGPAKCAAELGEGHSTLFRSEDRPSDPSRTYRRRLTVGLRFNVTKPGSVVAVRFFKAAAEGGAGHAARVYEATTGRLLGGTTTTVDDGRCKDGWVSIPLPTAIPVKPGSTYIAAIDSMLHWPASFGYFGGPAAAGDVVPVDRAGAVGPAAQMPDSYSSTNYWVDGEWAGKGGHDACQ